MGIAYLKGYCLRVNREAAFGYSADAMGSYYFCHACGRLIVEPVGESLHVFEPSPALLDVLNRKGNMAEIILHSERKNRAEQQAAELKCFFAEIEKLDISAESRERLLEYYHRAVLGDEARGNAG